MANKPHKHAELIKAWADGAEIEVFSEIQKEWQYIDNPMWYENNSYRIKPEPKPDVVRYVYLSVNHGYKTLNKGCNAVVTFDGETGKLKSAEVINEQ